MSTPVTVYHTNIKITMFRKRKIIVTYFSVFLKKSRIYILKAKGADEIMIVFKLN